MSSIKIQPYPDNAKKHPNAQLEAIAASIKRFGWQQPIVVDKQGIIIVGHGRYMAWEKYLDTKVEPWVVDNEGKTVLGKQGRELTRKEIQAYRLADNKLNESDWDLEMAIEELHSIGDPDLQKLTGFDMDLLLEPDEKDDEVPEIPDEPRSKLDDLYQLGPHRLLCGDSTKKEDVERLMDGKKADMVFTDPPYNVNYKGQGENTSNTILNDKMSDESFNTFLIEVFKRFDEVSKKGAGWYVFHSSSTQHQFQEAIEKAGWTVKNQIIWNKPMAALGWGDYRWKHEPFFYCGKGETTFYGDRTHSTVIDMPLDDHKALSWLKQQKEAEKKGYSTIWSMKRENTQGYLHPTQKPVELITYALRNNSKEGDIVLDLFGGSGATLIAAEKLGREAYLNELDPKYVDVIVQRYVDYVDNPKIILNNKDVTNLWPKTVAKTEKTI